MNHSILHQILHISVYLEYFYKIYPNYDEYLKIHVVAGLLTDAVYFATIAFLLRCRFRKYQQIDYNVSEFA